MRGETTSTDLRGEDPRFTREDWKYEVANEDTQLGYGEWVEHRIEATGDDEE